MAKKKKGIPKPLKVTGRTLDGLLFILDFHILNLYIEKERSAHGKVAFEATDWFTRRLHKMKNGEDDLNEIKSAIKKVLVDIPEDSKEKLEITKRKMYEQFAVAIRRINGED